MAMPTACTGELHSGSATFFQVMIAKSCSIPGQGHMSVSIFSGIHRIAALIFPKVSVEAPLCCIVLCELTLPLELR